MIDDTYTFQEIIGFGGSSKVFSVTDDKSDKYAIKAIRKDKGYQSEMESMMVLREYLVMEHIGEHPHIIKHISCNPEGSLQLDGNYQDICYNVMEYCENGSLSTFWKKRAFDEWIARFIFTQLASAVHYLHSKNFAHLDLKLENTLLDQHFNVKLADFGSGVSLIKTKGKTDHRVGTPLYMAPEIKDLQKGETFEGLPADIYSLGVTLCLMLLGEIPDSLTSQNVGSSTIGSSEMTDDEQMEDIESKRNFSKEDCLSPEWRDLLSWMMQKDPQKRPTIDQILTHDWISSESFEGLQYEVYSEMQLRKEQINNTIRF